MTQIPSHEGHPEDYCHRCGGPNIKTWFADSPLWNQVMRGGSINGHEPFNGIICPICFAALAKEQGVATHWRLVAKDVQVELETVTPSGRVWNDTTHLWEEDLVANVAELASAYRARHHGTDELVLVLPRWMWDRYGQDQLTAAFQRNGIQHVKLVEDWAESSEENAQLLLYAAGTWHTNHHIGQTRPDCEGCQHNDHG